MSTIIRTIHRGNSGCNIVRSDNTTVINYLGITSSFRAKISYDNASNIPYPISKDYDSVTYEDELLLI